MVEPLERRQLQIDLTSDFEQRWSVARQRLGDIGDRANIVGDVLADLAVAPGGALDEDTVLVAQRDGEAIELQLDTEPGHRLPSRRRCARSFQLRRSSMSKALCSDIIGTVWVTARTPR